MALVIALLAAVAVGLVQIRRAEIAARHEIEKLQRQQVALRRKMWDQQIQMGILTTPEEIRRRAIELGLQLPQGPQPRYRLADVEPPGETPP